MPDLGDLIPFSVQIRDENGILTNATTVVLTVTLPDGTTTTPFVANPPTVTGEYKADYLPTQVGRHFVRWVSTGPSAAFTDTFDVRDHLRSIISLSEAKKALNIPVTQTADDEEIRWMIEAATYAIERHRLETIPRTSYTEEFWSGRTDVIVPANRPIISVTSISVDGFALNVNDFRVDQTKSAIIREAGPNLSGTVLLTYQAGFPNVPPHYVAAAKITLAHLWQAQRMPSLGQTTGFGVRGSGTQEQIMTPSGFGYALPPRAIELLGQRPSMVV